MDLRQALVGTPINDLDHSWLFVNYQNVLDLLRTATISGRTAAADTVSVWIQRCLQINDPGAAVQVVSLESLTEIYYFICDNWNDATPALSNALRDLFKKLLSLKTRLYPENSAESWVRYIAAFPSSNKALYYVIEPLAKFLPNPYSWGLEQGFYNRAFALMSTLEHANPVGKALASLLHFHKGTDRNQWVREWSQYVYRSLKSPSRTNVLIYFLPLILRGQPLEVFDAFYGGIPDPSLEDATGCLKVAHELDLDISRYMDSSMTECLHHASRSLRVEVLSLLTISKQTSRPVPRSTYEAIKQNSDALLCEADPKFRNQVYGLLRQFVFRVRGSTYGIVRDFKGEGEPTEVTEAKEFFGWLPSYMSELLQPGTPYRGLVTAFQYLELLAVSGLDKRVDSKHFEASPVPFAFSVDIFDRDLVRDLINNIPNDYQDIRRAAAKLIEMAPTPVPFLENNEQVDKIAAFAEPLIAGVRGRQGDGGARVAQLVYRSYDDLGSQNYLNKLLESTEQKVSMAVNDLKSAVEDHGVHGYFQSLALIAETERYKQTASKETITRMLECAAQIWVATRDVLTNGAPEGNIPMPSDAGFEEGLSSKYGALGQVILSYSWRAVRESANLLMVLMPVLEVEQLKPLGELLIEQLTSIRHRGAFMSITGPLQACCSRCYAVPTLQSLPLEWLETHLQEILIHTKLITRRSAGLPLLVTSILVSHPKPLEPAVDRVMDRLFEIANIPIPISTEESKLDLPQVHAFNCIKATLWESLLTKPTARHVERALVLAIMAFTSPVWAIRNCGVMLFSTLHNRLFGVRVASMSARVFFTRFKSIRRLLYDHLNVYVASASSADLETVYPILSLLLRLESVGNYDGLVDFEAPIYKLLSSAIWKIREMAAWVFAAIIQPNNTVKSALELIDACTVQNQNLLHGHAMALNSLKVDTTNQEILTKLRQRAGELYFNNKSPETRVEVFKLLEKFGMKPKFVWAEASPYLSPSENVLKGLIAAREMKDGVDDDVVAQFLASDVDDVHFSVLDELRHVSAKLYAPLLGLLGRTKNPFVKVACLDAISKKDEGNFGDLSYLLDEKEAQSVREKALESLGKFAATAADAERDQWLNAVCDFAQDDSPSAARLSALVSCQSFLSKKPEMDENFKDSLFYQIYMLLSDDEEMLRDRAGQVASEIVGASTAWEPRYCEARLVELISPGFRAKQRKGLAPIGEQVSAALETDETLFVVEKANLYRDETRLVKQLGSGEKCAIPDRLAQLDLDSPLGWSTNAEISLLMARLGYAR
ncbi:hypothetical protein B9G98_03848 [Wickerhamiella sorbophila]|uniref:Uncharacterized protein n=1 Tax=Wickerhamiella sorbophila TaxID=45607 RepID=A0A2T0FMK4_9ASCO|nr:hypothetical protein B9G98_03848 [Wickerhamiella sorbophila]PRT56228.1 hypothetical protein B9G98_03848 [Wickerhamiella sorbophila]